MTRMVAIFTLALVLARTVSLVFFGLISFLAFKEYLSLIPTRRADRRVLLWAYLSIPVQYLWVGYEWYGMTFRLLTGSLLRSNLFTSILRRHSNQPLPVSPGEALNRFRQHEDMGEITDFPTWIPDQVAKWIAAGIGVYVNKPGQPLDTRFVAIPGFKYNYVTRDDQGEIRPKAFWGKL